jgi:putative ABC transport system ATP-binding protein
MAGVRAEDLLVTFQGSTGGPALDIPLFEVEDSAQLCVVGRSGSGKSTLLNALAGIIRPNAGSIRIGEIELASLTEAARDRFRAAHIGYIFQTFNLLQPLSAAENVAFAGTLAGLSRGAARVRARELLHELGLEARAEALPSELSVGEQQRVALARALVATPGVVLADEPTANLDPENRDAAISLLRGAVEKAGSTLILVTHEVGIRDSFDQVINLEELSR